MKHFNLLFCKIIFLLLCILFVNNTFSQEFRGFKAQKIVRNADYVVKDTSLYIPTLIQFIKGKEIEYSGWKDWLKQYFRISGDLNFILIGTEKDNLNEIHYRYQQTYKEIPVYGSIYIVHTKNNKVISMNGKILDKFENNNAVSLSEKQALSFALNYVNATKYKWQIPEQEKFLKYIKNDSDATYFPKGELTYISESGAFNSEKYVLTYKFDIYADKPLSKQDIYVDVITGKIVMTRNKLFTTDVQGTAHTKYSGIRTITTDSVSPSLYRLRETGRGNGIETYNWLFSTNSTGNDFIDTDNDWNNVNAQQDEAATDAHWGAEMTYDYFYNKHNRNSIDNAGFILTSLVHYVTYYANAYWDGTRVTYGDGDSIYSPYTALEICGHEFTHGLTSFSANLDYGYESGALNEGFSDIFGTCIEWYGKPPLTPNWTCGEDIGIPFRSMSNPNLYSCPDTYLGTNWYTDAYDYGGVHINSGIINYWFYLLANGGTGTNDLGNSYNVTGITIDSAAAIAYRTLTVYLINTSGFADARTYSIQAAVDLFGSCSPEVEAVTDAWYAVGIGAQYSAFVISDFSACPVSFSSAPAYTTFANNTLNGISYKWYFGDGTTSTAINPNHTYITTGNFDVKLVAYGGVCGNDSITKLSYINIGSAYPASTTMPSLGYDTITDCNGILFDNGGCSDYSNNTSGILTIAPTGATNIILNFISFNFVPYWDYLNIYDGPNASSPLIGQYSGTTFPNGGTIISTGNSITLEQYTLISNVASGFELNWTCSNPNNPPIVNFYTTDTTSCTGIIQFTDSSLNTPTSWNWDFGDGGTSNLQNPVHTYTTSGIYSVTLISTNSHGTDTLTKTNYITVNLPANPIANSATICGSGSTTLTATGTGKINWYNTQTGGTIINTGTTYTTPFLTSSKTYYVESEIIPPAVYGGKPNNIGGGYYYSNTGLLIFDCYTPVNLVSVDVYANSTGNRTIELQNSTGTVLQSATVNIPAIGLNTIPLNFPLPVGTNMRLTLSYTSASDLYRNSVASFPYTIPGILSITTGGFGVNDYLFFYNWKIQSPSCFSSRVPVTAYVVQSTPDSVSISANQPDTICPGTNVTFTALPFNGGSSPSYGWLVNGSLITTNTSGIFSNNINSGSDVVNCVMTSSTPCALNNPDTSNSIQFNVLQSAIGGNITASDDTLCSGDTLTLTVSNYTGQIQWQDSSTGNIWTNITAANTPLYTNNNFTTSGFYRAVLSLGTCPDSSSDIIQINLLQLPIAGFTYNTNSGTVNFFNSSIDATGYYWDFGDGTNSALQNPVHTYSSNGTYAVSLKAINNCGDSTVIQNINIVLTGIENDFSENYLEVIPNPNNGIFEIKIFSNENKDLQLNIFNVEGKKILSDNIKCTSKEISKNIDLSKFEKGIYHLEVISDIGVVNKIIIVQ